MIEEIIKNIALGAFYGTQAALFGYMKDENLPLSWTAVFTKKFWETFSPVKAFKTIVLGAFMGAFGTFSILNTENKWLDPTETLIIYNFAYSAIVMGVDQFIKFVVRRTPIVRAWNYLKAKWNSLPLQ